MSTDSAVEVSQTDRSSQQHRSTGPSESKELPVVIEAVASDCDLQVIVFCCDCDTGKDMQ
jgi:hypothetical protein